MSLVWTLIAVFLYAEIAIVLLLVLPVVTPQKWQKLFKSRFLDLLGRQAGKYFYLLLIVLVLFLMEAIREMRKYSHHHDPSQEAHLQTEMQHSMRLFRAQRNFYISGFSIFLSLVIRRLVTLISAHASLLAQSEASMKQAQSATQAARSLLSEKDAKQKGESADNGKQKDEINELKGKIHELTSELNKEKKDKEAMKSQADSLNKEYDRLTEEYSKLEKKIAITTAGVKEE